MRRNSISYSRVGDDYASKDQLKRLAQKAAKETSDNLKKLHFSEISGSRGESAYVWRQGKILMTSVVEG